MSEDPIERVVILGGGTAGWMAAASLAQQFEKLPMEIVLVESPRIGTVGVGEASIPTLRRFCHRLGLDDRTLLERTGGTCKLGIEFRDWRRSGTDFFHPFALFGQHARGLEFHHYWSRLYRQGQAKAFDHYSLAVEMARRGRFAPPPERPPASYARYDWALHLDSARFAALLREYALARGVEHVQGEVEQVALRPDDGYIESLALEDGRRLDGELFIDCSGFGGRLIERALGAGYESWSRWLLCDSAWVVASQAQAEPPPYTLAKAHGAGWQWGIPLRERGGNGHVYASDFVGDDEAAATLLEHLPTPAEGEPRKLTFEPGRRRYAWYKNCVALGLAAGFLEPLESTSIALIQTGLEKLITLFPDRSFAPSLRDEYNEMTRLEYERVRDFIILHYCASERRDSAFWREVTSMAVPEPLAGKMRAFRERGHLIKYRWEIFQEPSWLALYAGMGLVPERSHPLARQYELDYLRESLAQIRRAIEASAETAGSHRDFIGLG